jgi:hypothetical protein
MGCPMAWHLFLVVSFRFGVLPGPELKLIVQRALLLAIFLAILLAILLAIS